MRILPIMLLSFILVIFCNISSSFAINALFLQSMIKHLKAQCLYFVHDFDFQILKEIEPIYFGALYGPLAKRYPEAHRTIVVATIPEEIDEVKKLIETHPLNKMKWIIFNDQLMNFMDIFKNINIPFDCEFIIAERNALDSYNLTEIYKIKAKSNLTSSYWGTWDTHQNIQTIPGDMHSRRQNLMGEKFQLIALEGTQNSPDQLYVDKMVGYISDAMNFTINTIFWELGILYPNGTKSGVYKMMDHPDIDFATLPFVVTPLRLKWLTFIWPITSVKTYLFLAVGEEKDWKSYLKPFDDELWFTLGAWMVLSFFCLFCLYNWQQNSLEVLDCTSEAYLHVFSPYCAQGTDVSDVAALFLAHLMPYINALVLIPAYSGAILAFITIPIHTLPFHDINGFVDNGNYKLSYIPVTYISIYFSTSDGAIPEIIRKRNLIQPANLLPPDANLGFQQICADHSLVYIDSIPPEPNMECQIVKLSEEFLEQPIGLSAATNTPFRTLAIRVVRRIHSAGLMKLYQEVIMPPIPEYSFKPLDIENVYFLFILYFVLFITSLIILLLEINQSYFNKSKSLHKKQLHFTKHPVKYIPFIR